MCKRFSARVLYLPSLYRSRPNSTQPKVDLKTSDPTSIIQYICGGINSLTPTKPANTNKTPIMSNIHNADGPVELPIEHPAAQRPGRGISAATSALPRQSFTSAPCWPSCAAPVQQDRQWRPLPVPSCGLTRRVLWTRFGHTLAITL